MHMYLRKNKYAFYNENQIRTRTHLCINFCSNLLKYVHILDMTLCIQMRSVGQCSVHSCSLSLIKQMLVCTGNAKLFLFHCRCILTFEYCKCYSIFQKQNVCSGNAKLMQVKQFCLVNLTLGKFGPHPGGSCGGQGGSIFLCGNSGGVLVLDKPQKVEI